MPYPCDALIAIVTAWLGWQLARGQARMALPLALWLALAIGLRPWTALAMLPLALHAAGQAARSGVLRPLQLVGALLTGGILGLAWLLPIGAPTAANPDLRQGAVFVLSSQALVANLGMLVRAGAWGWGLAALPVLGALPRWALDRPGFRARRGRWGWVYDERVWFCAVWAAPCCCSPCCWVSRRLGRSLPACPSCCFERRRAGSHHRQRDAPPGDHRGNAADPRQRGAVPGRTRVHCAGRLPAAWRSADRLPGSSAGRGDRDDLAASPSETVILANNWLPVHYYLPAYQFIPYQIEPSTATDEQAQRSPEQQAALQQATTLVWFEPALDRYNRSPNATELQTMAIGTLRILRPISERGSVRRARWVWAANHQPITKNRELENKAAGIAEQLLITNLQSPLSNLKIVTLPVTCSCYTGR